MTRAGAPPTDGYTEWSIDIGCPCLRHVTSMPSRPITRAHLTA